MKVIFGLGNPGQRYKKNRHNIGHIVVEQLTSKRFKSRLLLAGLAAEEIIDKERVLLVKPRTFMNNSGVCAKKVLNRYRISHKGILVVYDDIDLPLGAMRFRQKGSCAGHRGISSVMSVLGTEEISRLRIGIGNTDVDELSEYVLSDFSPSEMDVVQEVVGRAALACRDWVINGVDFVMRSYNRRGG